jgi:hypothetical protein
VAAIHAATSLTVFEEVTQRQRTSPTKVPAGGAGVWLSHLAAVSELTALVLWKHLLMLL